MASILASAYGTRRAAIYLCPPAQNPIRSDRITRLWNSGGDSYMLSIHDGRHSRRSFLQIGGLGLAGLTLADMLRVKAHAADTRSSILKDRSVIFLFLHGGPSQIETFDPKMTAARE